MDFSLEDHHRRSIRIKGYDYSGPGGYFVTVATRGRVCLFGEVLNGEMRLNGLGEIVREYWNEIPTHFTNVEIGEFVIMPNHLHGIIIIHESTVGATHESPLRDHASPLRDHASPLRDHTSSLRDHALTIKRPPHGPPPHSLGVIVGLFKSSVSRRANRELNMTSIWQRNYYEHILRNQADHNRIAKYIASNPTNWELDKENLEIRE